MLALNQQASAPSCNSNKKIQVVKDGEDMVIKIGANNLSSEEDESLETEEGNRWLINKERQLAMQKSRSISESSGDELSSSNASNNGGKSKGILKYRRHGFSRSVSESSIDDSAALVSSSVDYARDDYPGFHEMYSECEGSSLKKTVRFNDVVSRQLYR